MVLDPKRYNCENVFGLKFRYNGKDCHGKMPLESLLIYLPPCIVLLEDKYFRSGKTCNVPFLSANVTVTADMEVVLIGSIVSS